MKRYYFKQFLITASLILILECFQLLLNVSYYPISKISIPILNSAIFILILVSISSIIINLAIYYLIKVTPLKASYFETASELLCTIVLGFFYIPAFILVFHKNFPETIDFFWKWGYGVIPLFWALCVIASNIWMRKKFKYNYQKTVSLLWRPAYALMIISFGWLIISNISHRFTHEKIEEPSAQLTATAENYKSKPNIILITFDQLSPTYMSLYGYPLKTTPFWEEFAKESYVFEKFRCNICETTPALISMFSSKYPWTHGVLEWPQYLKTNEEENIIASLADDYYTAAFVPSIYQLPDILGFTDYFDHQEWVGFDFPNYLMTLNTFYKAFFREELHLFSIPVIRHALYFKNGFQFVSYDEVFKAATPFLDDLDNRPFFLWTHLWPTHAPHVAPPAFKGLFSSQKDEKIEKYNEYTLFSDSALKNFIDQLKSRGLYDNSIIIVSADHGVSFGIDMMSYFLFERLVRIPLLIHLPKQTKGERIIATAEQIDLAPTILDLIDKPIPSWMEGESLLPYLQGEKSQTQRIKFTMEYGSNTNPEINSLAVFKGEYKLIYQKISGAAVLYNLTKDPQEKENLAHKLPKITAELINEANKIYPKISEVY